MFLNLIKEELMEEIEHSKKAKQEYNAFQAQTTVILQLNNLMNLYSLLKK